MKRLFFIVWLALAATAAAGQKLAIGDKAPDLKAREWPYGRPADESIPRLLEFFYTRSTPCLERLPRLQEMATRYAGRLSVVLVCREEAADLARVLGMEKPPYFAALDDGGRTFTAYGVQYVPFGVVIDRKGRIAWFGNPVALTVEELDKLLK